MAVLATALLFTVSEPASAWENDLAEVTISESGGLSPRTLSALGTIAAVLGVDPTVMQSGTIRLHQVSRAGTVVQSFDPGFAVPMSFIAVDPFSAAPLLGGELSSALEGGVVMSEASAALRGAAAGDEITLEAWDGTFHEFSISAVMPDGAIAWNELVFPTAVATTLGIDRPSRAVMWGVNTTVVDFLARAVLGDAPIRVHGPGSESEPFVDGVLPMVMVKQRFGEFSYRATGSDGIETDDEWYGANIVTVVLPRLGQFRCHRAVMPYVEGALDELEATGLAEEIESEDFQLAGGCYNPRLARGGDLDRGFALSRHSWGIAIDFNPTSNGFGAEPTLSEAFGQVMRDWGFAWGAGWRIPDAMHFEWHGEPADPARADCVVRLSGVEPPWEFGDAPRTCRQ
ncbi:MAG TPA: M15 family metallopeptidase [Acidimicrobiia bacterium]|nr:M15 family metallopeptidase [Acidimicrobiia bacterium]